MNESRVFRYPFKEQPGNVIGEGTVWGKSKVMEQGSDWVIKETVAILKTLQESKSDYDVLKNWLADYIPETQFIQGQNAKGETVNLIRQKRIRGRRLFDYTMLEIMSNQTLKMHLVDFFSKCIRMWEEAGRIPDLTGISEPFRSRNVLVEDGTGKLFLVDTSAPESRFSKKAMLLFHLRAAWEIKKMRVFINKNQK